MLLPPLNYSQMGKLHKSLRFNFSVELPLCNRNFFSLYEFFFQKNIFLFHLFLKENLKITRCCEMYIYRVHLIELTTKLKHLCGKRKSVTRDNHRLLISIAHNHSVLNFTTTAIRASCTQIPTAVRLKRNIHALAEQ